VFVHSSLRPLQKLNSLDYQEAAIECREQWVRYQILIITALKTDNEQPQYIEHVDLKLVSKQVDSYSAVIAKNL